VVVLTTVEYVVLALRLVAVVLELIVIIVAFARLYG
jgi:hypothetical protein